MISMPWQMLWLFIRPLPSTNRWCSSSEILPSCFESSYFFLSSWYVPTWTTENCVNGSAPTPFKSDSGNTSSKQLKQQIPMAADCPAGQIVRHSQHRNISSHSPPFVSQCARLSNEKIKLGQMIIHRKLTQKLMNICDMYLLPPTCFATFTHSRPCAKKAVRNNTCS